MIGEREISPSDDLGPSGSSAADKLTICLQIESYPDVSSNKNWKLSKTEAPDR
jgi:hypothetical protein